jgi:hypothetical protein
MRWAVRLLVVATAVLAGCSGHTTGTTNVGRTAATLTATARCDSGETCRWYWELWIGERSNVGRTAVSGPVNGPTGDLKITKTLTDLNPGTTYHWDLCGSPDNGAHYACVGPSGKLNERDSEQFTTAPQHTLAERWDGTAWSVQATPTVAGEHAAWLGDVSCPTTTACTAMGGYDVEHLRAVRWNGTSWALQAAVEASSSFRSVLVGISCPTATECLAGGYFVPISDPYGSRTLAERWNGSAWAITGAAALPDDAGLADVACSAAGACTAVGGQFNGQRGVTLGERWNGTSWTVQSTPNGATGGGGLSGVSCASATSCVAVGSEITGGASDKGDSLALHWNGSSWTVQATPHPAGVYTTLLGVSCTAANACMAVGYRNDGGTHTPLIERWNGTSWSLQSTPAVSGGGELQGISCSSATACTAVGWHGGSTRPLTLAERWNGSSWAVQPTPNPAGGASKLFGVSCPSATACTAVGY